MLAAQQVGGAPGPVIAGQDDERTEVGGKPPSDFGEFTAERTTFESSPDYKPVARRSASLICSCQPGPSS